MTNLCPEDVQRNDNILIVDDNPRNLAVLQDILDQSGYAVRPAITGRLALLSALSRVPDLVLLDIRLPDMDGYEVCRELKKNPITADVPVIFISALDDPLDKIKAFSEGGVDYITKPFHAEEVVVRIRTHLSLRNVQLELQEARKNLEERVQRRTEERTLLARAVEQVAESIIITDSHERILYVNPFFEKITGYGREEVVGLTPKLRRSGCHDDSFYDQIRQTLARGRGWQGRMTSRCRDGSQVEEDATISPVFDESGKITHYIAVKRDVTRTLQMERQLQQAQKMEAIGTLAGGIAHDFNNILGAIIGCAEVAMAELPASSRAHSDLERVLSSGQRARRLVQQILTFSRQSENDRRPLRLRSIIKETVKFLRASLPATVEIVTTFLEDNWLVLADPVQIQQILLNLSSNGAHAIGSSGGILEIRLESRSLSEAEAESIGGISSGDYLLLSVRDSGHGMSGVVLDRIFDPFFTTKGIGEGTGLGLSVVHGIVTDLGGRMFVESSPGKGSVFHIYLARGEKGRGDDGVLPVVPGSFNSERILLVDDEVYLAEAMGKNLRQLGYRVDVHVRSTTVLESFSREADSYDAVICDLTMPRMRGDELVRKIRVIRPDIPIILCTGYSDSISADGARLGLHAILYKPVLKWQLAQCLADVLQPGWEGQRREFHG
jgi:PAS domain S-box-containing protein